MANQNNPLFDKWFRPVLFGAAVGIIIVVYFLLRPEPQPSNLPVKTDLSKYENEIKVLKERYEMRGDTLNLLFKEKDSLSTLLINNHKALAKAKNEAKKFTPISARRAHDSLMSLAGFR